MRVTIELEKITLEEDRMGEAASDRYVRYHIETRPVEDLVRWPNRFLVKVNRFQLAKLLLTEVIQQRGDLKAITSRPCMYGTFSGPIGGFAPRPQHCVGCLRCTTQHPETVRILPNPERQALGDSFFQAATINAVSYEAQTGSIPVKGAGYRGAFGGDGWDGMWTDMSEIVRPTRDGIHGREFISTSVDIGEKPAYLVFDADGHPVGVLPRAIPIPIPFIYDVPPESVWEAGVLDILWEAARTTKTMAVLPLRTIVKMGEGAGLQGTTVIPLVRVGEEMLLSKIGFEVHIIEIDGEQADPEVLRALVQTVQETFPQAVLALRLPFTTAQGLAGYFQMGVRVFHLTTNLHGRGADGRFVLDWIRDVHQGLVAMGVRDEVTLIGSGGLVAAEHVPKAIICGLDLVGLDTPLLVAIQARFEGECITREESRFQLPSPLDPAWGVQRVANLTAAWRDQLLEILGAMGLREVRRLRGEIGRAMFQADLEREAFGEIEGFEERAR